LVSHLNAVVERDEMGAASLLERLSGVGPVEGVGHGRVVVGDELSELGLEVGHRGEVAAAQALSMDDAEKDFDLVEPRAIFTVRAMCATNSGSVRVASSVGETIWPVTTSRPAVSVVVP